MLFDKENLVSNAQAVTASAASTDYIDLAQANQEPGMAGDLEFVITCTETATSAGASTVTFKLQTDDATNFPSATDVAVSAAIAKASLVAGYQLVMKLPYGINERYMRLYYTVGTADLTAGKFTAGIVRASQKWSAKPAVTGY